MTHVCNAITLCSRKPSCKEPQHSFATWQLLPATCSSAHAACTSATPRCHATNVNPAPDARPSPTATARLLFLAQASIASPPTHQTCAWPWRRWKQQSTSRVRKAHAQSHSAIFISCREIHHIEKPCWSRATLSPTSLSRRQSPEASSSISSYAIARLTNLRWHRQRWCLRLPAPKSREPVLRSAGWGQNHGGRRKRKLH